MSHFRPIALCNVLYKVIAKILANRIRPLLHKMITLSQNAFVPGRQINNNIIAHEIQHPIRSSRNSNSSFALTIDMAKAYDKLSWDVISQTLLGFDLTYSSHDLLMQCITTVSFEILVNDTPSDIFFLFRGICQGCLLFPYFFIMCGELLSIHISIMERNGLCSGIRLSRYQGISYSPSYLRMTPSYLAPVLLATYSKSRKYLLFLRIKVRPTN